MVETTKLTVQVVARYLGITQQGVLKAIHEGRMKAEYDEFARRYVIDPDEAQRYREAMRNYISGATEEKP